MKKENVLKKVLINSIIGFPIGVTLLIIAYISVYFITNENVFNTELYQLHNINILISQAISYGISGYLLFISIYILSIPQNTENRLMAEHPYKTVFTTTISFIFIIVIIILILGNTSIFSENISTLNILILIIFS